MNAVLAQEYNDRKAGLIRRLGPFAGLILVVLVFAVLSGAPERYLSLGNLRVVLAQTVIVATGATGMTMIIISAGIDLSVGSSVALTSVVTALALRSSWNPAAAVLAGLFAGGLIGAMNGAVITTLRVIPFIATLGMLGVARGAAKWLAGEQTVNPPQTWINQLAVTFPPRPWMLVAPGVWLTIALAVLISLVLTRTVFGRHLFALGSNERAARACGIATNRLKIIIYASAGLFFGLAGVLQMSRLRWGSNSMSSRRSSSAAAA